MNKKIKIIILLLIFAIAGSILFVKKSTPSDIPKNFVDLNVSVSENFSEDILINQETIKVKVFFINNILDPEVSCNKVFPVEREIVKTPAIARAALNELLAGPTIDEEKNGFIKVIGSDVKVQNLTIENGVAKVDFSEQLEEGAGGSCRGAAIVSQINATLKQFDSVKDVIISINGRTEDILQP